MTGSKEIEGKQLILLQVNCRSILNKTLEFRNLVHTCNPYVIKGTESWLREEINNTELFRDDYTTFKGDRCTGGCWIVRLCSKVYQLHGTVGR
jgi:hypothetical protein